jgi:hypothetical protein
MHAGSVLKNVRPLILETAAKFDHSLVLAREVESRFSKESQRQVVGLMSTRMDS